MGFLDKYAAIVEHTETIKQIGRVQAVQGLQIESYGPQAQVGELCQIVIEKQARTVLAEVVGLRDAYVQLAPYADTEGIEVGNPVVGLEETLTIPVSERLLGRILDGSGRPIDGKGDIGSAEFYSAFSRPPDVLRRRRITEQVETGIRAIDGLIPTGKGQRLGIFSGSGVGKSTLVGMIARNTTADISVIALIGERGREVREFLENDLGPEGLERSVVVVSTSDTPAMARLRAAYVSMAVAEYFRDKGNDVVLMFDSVTRFARAQREIGLSRGEGPASRGFPPSMDAILPQLLERCGTSEYGSITGFFSVLVEGDDLDEPVSDAVRGILDGHVVLSRDLARRYHYPAIDVLGSVSRLEPKIVTKTHREVAGAVRRYMAVYRDAEDLINAGIYQEGTNQEIDESVEMRPLINDFLRQDIEESTSLEETKSRLFDIVGVDEVAAADTSGQVGPVQSPEEQAGQATAGQERVGRARAPEEPLQSPEDPAGQGRVPEEPMVQEVAVPTSGVESDQEIREGPGA